MSDRAILSLPIDVAHIPADPVVLEASEVERARLAEANDLVAVKSVAATVTLTPGVRGSVTVDGRVVADIVQTCVVTLAPLDAHIDETFSIRFVKRADAPPEPKAGVEIVLDMDAPDPPEVLDGPTIDVGALVEETFVLAIDPYPRAPGAELPADVAGTDDPAADSPFAALAALAKGRREPE